MGLERSAHEPDLWAKTYTEHLHLQENSTFQLRKVNLKGYVQLPCPEPSGHPGGRDLTPSFGFNIQTGTGYCFVPSCKCHGHQSFTRTKKLFETRMKRPLPEVQRIGTWPARHKNDQGIEGYGATTNGPEINPQLERCDYRFWYRDQSGEAHKVVFRKTRGYFVPSDEEDDDNVRHNIVSIKVEDPKTGLVETQRGYWKKRIWMASKTQNQQGIERWYRIRNGNDHNDFYHSEIMRVGEPNPPIYYVVESEKDADFLQQIFTLKQHQERLNQPKEVAITWLGGAGSWEDVGKTNWNKLAGADVILCPDNDKPGRACMHEVAEALVPIAGRMWALSTKDLGLPSGWGLADLIPQKQNIYEFCNKHMVSIDTMHQAKNRIRKVAHTR